MKKGIILTGNTLAPPTAAAEAVTKTLILTGKQSGRTESGMNRLLSAVMKQMEFTGKGAPALASAILAHANLYEEAGLDTLPVGTKGAPGADGMQHLATGLHAEVAWPDTVRWGCYLSGKMVGTWCTATTDGQLLSTAEYEDGRRHGALVRHEEDGHRTVTWWVRGERVPCDTQTGDAGLPF